GDDVTPSSPEPARRAGESHDTAALMTHASASAAAKATLRCFAPACRLGATRLVGRGIGAVIGPVDCEGATGAEGALVPARSRGARWLDSGGAAPEGTRSTPAGTGTEARVSGARTKAARELLTRAIRSGERASSSLSASAICRAVAKRPPGSLLVPFRNHSSNPAGTAASSEGDVGVDVQI